MKTIVPALVLLSLCISAWSAGIDQSPFGMNGLKLAHARNDPNVWTNAERTAKVMKDAGMYWDRLELWWGVIEPEKGKFDWTFSDKVAQFYRKQEINALVILCYSSAWSKDTPPATPEERALYADYVYQMVNRYKDTFKVWEIWNEPNIPTFWPEPNVRDYTLMLQEAYKAAKKADPDCMVFAGSTSGPDLEFIDGIYKNGGWDSCDGISIHPYSMAGGPIPQRLDKILRQNQEYIASKGKPKPLWITEMGWTSSNAREDRDQAVYVIQSYVMALANGVGNLQWFCLDDWAEKWGLVRSFEPFDPKPSYKAYQLLAETLGSPGKCAEFEGYLKMPEGVACYVFKKSENQRILILWTDDARITRTVKFPKVTGSWHVTDILGEKMCVPSPDITVGAVPIIITGVRPGDIGQVNKTFNPYLEKSGMNIALNGSMEWLNEHGGADWWNAGRFEGSAKDGTFATTDAGRSGSKCVSISKSGERAAYDQGPIPVDAGKEYRMTAWIKTENATGSNQIGLFWYSGNQWTYKGEVRSENITGTHDWTKVEVTAKVPEGASLVRPNLISENNTGTAWFDDIVLEEVE